MFRKFFMAVPIVVLAIGGSTACATKKFVRTSVGEVNDKVDSLGRSVEETQERTRQNEGRITEVDTEGRGGRAGGAGGQRRRVGSQLDTATERRHARPTPRPTRSTRPASGSCSKSC